jgi:hypothetical protein
LRTPHAPGKRCASRQAESTGVNPSRRSRGLFVRSTLELPGRRRNIQNSCGTMARAMRKASHRERGPGEMRTTWPVSRGNFGSSHTWGNSGIEPYSGSRNQLSRNRRGPPHGALQSWREPQWNTVVAGPPAFPVLLSRHGTILPPTRPWQAMIADSVQMAVERNPPDPAPKSGNCRPETRACQPNRGDVGYSYTWGNSRIEPYSGSRNQLSRNRRGPRRSICASSRQTAS